MGTGKNGGVTIEIAQLATQLGYIDCAPSMGAL